MLTYEEYAKIRDSKGLKDVDVSRLAGVNQTTFSEWKKGKATPKFEKMSKIERALGVVHLYTEDNYIVMPDNPVPAAPTFSDVEVRIIEAYRLADPVTQANILKLLDVKGDAGSDAAGRSVV